MSWSFISSPPGWWAIYCRDGNRMAMPIVAWRMDTDNRDPEDILNNPEAASPYGEPMIQSGDGMLESAFGQGGYIGHELKQRSDFRDGWMFEYADFIPKTKGILRRPKGDCIWWELV
jgi:hypothetical protein